MFSLFGPVSRHQFLGNRWLDRCYAPNTGERDAAAWESYVKPKPEDNVHDEYFIQAEMKEKGGFKSVDGGKTVNAHIEYALNPNVGWVTENGVLPTTKPETFDQAQYSWKILAGTTSFTEFEKAINQGSGAKYDLKAARMESLRKTMFRYVNQAIFGTAIGQQPGGLQDLVDVAPTTGTRGGINRATFVFWRNQAASAAKTTTAFDNLRSVWGSLYNSASLGISGPHPGCLVTTQTIYQGFESLLIANDRYVRKDSSDKGASGYKSKALLFKDLTTYYDAMCPSGNAYLLTFENFKLAYASGFWMKAFPAVDPANQLGDVFKVMTVCVPVTDNPRRLAVAYSTT